MSTLEKLDKKLDALIALRGQHDQTIRTQVIKICYPGGADVGETDVFLEAHIARLTIKLQTACLDELENRE